MKLLGIIIAKFYPRDKRPVFLSSTHDISNFAFAYRNAVKEVSKFLSREIIPRVPVGDRHVIKHEDYQFCVAKYGDGITIALLMDTEYPRRIAFNCAGEVYDEFKASFTESIYRDLEKDDSLAEFTPRLRELLKKYRKPDEFDAITIANMKVDRNKQIAERQLVDVLANIGQINDLVEQSNDLSYASQQMFKNANKMKKGCCRIS